MVCESWQRGILIRKLDNGIQGKGLETFSKGMFESGEARMVIRKLELGSWVGWGNLVP